MPLYPIWIHDKKTPKPDAPVLYEISANGVFLHKETPFWKAVVPVRRISILEEQKPSFELRLPPIPKDLALSVAQFFYWITKTENTEALALLWWAGNNTYEVSVPSQRASYNHLGYDIPERTGSQLIGTLHSHGAMSAFHSCVDREDEQHFDGIHATFGDFYHPTKRKFSLSVQADINGERFALDPLMTIEGLIKSEVEPLTLPSGRTPFLPRQQERANDWNEQQWQGQKSGAPIRFPREPMRPFYSFTEDGELIPQNYLPPREWMQNMHFERPTRRWWQ